MSRLVTQPAGTPAELTLVIPRLLEPAAIRALPSSLRLPGAEGLLARSRRSRTPGKGLEECLCRLFGIGPEAGGDLPVGPLTRYARGEVSTGEFYLCADPVHLRPDIDRLYLMPPRELGLDSGEANALADTLRPYLDDYGWRLEVTAPDAWHLVLGEPPGIQTWPLPAVVGRNVHAYMPQGEAAGFWRRVLNELQMVLHTAPANGAREARGQPTVNSLWLWGGGHMPEGLPETPPWQGLWGEGLLLEGLARLQGSTPRVSPDGLDDWLAQAGEGRHVLVLQALRDASLGGEVQAWQEALDALEGRWLRPLLKALQRRRPGSLVVEPCDGRRFAAGPAGAWRIWRRARRLSAYIEG